MANLLIGLPHESDYISVDNAGPYPFQNANDGDPSTFVGGVKGSGGTAVLEIIIPFLSPSTISDISLTYTATRVGKTGCSSTGSAAVYVYQSGVWNLAMSGGDGTAITITQTGPWSNVTKIKVYVSGGGGGSCIGHAWIMEIIANGGNWVEVFPDGIASRNWYSIDSSDDGSKVIAVVRDSATTGKVWTSTDYGATWTERQPAGAVPKNWNFCSSNSDGTVLLVGAYGGRLYLSTNSGVSWTEVQPAGNVNKNWYNGDIDSDGSFIIVANIERLYISTDGGANWSETQPVGNVNRAWSNCRTDSTGTNLVAVSYDSISPGGRVYTSSNGGTNWTERQPAGNADFDWLALACSADGQTILVGRYAPTLIPLFKSTNGGVSWTAVSPPGTPRGQYSCVDLSNDGTKAILTDTAQSSNGLVYVSNDGGSTWVADIPNGQPEDWIPCDVSGNGLMLYAAYGVGRIYKKGVVVTGWPHNINYIANASIKKIAGVLMANIKKVAGTS